jgi:hypothetical protein
MAPAGVQAKELVANCLKVRRLCASCRSCRIGKQPDACAIAIGNLWFIPLAAIISQKEQAVIAKPPINRYVKEVTFKIRISRAGVGIGQNAGACQSAISSASTGTASTGSADG